MAEKFIAINQDNLGNWQAELLGVEVSTPQLLTKSKNRLLPNIDQMFYNIRGTIPFIEDQWPIVKETYRELWLNTGKMLFEFILGSATESQIQDLTNSNGPIYLKLPEEAQFFPWELLWNNRYLDSGASSPIVRYMGHGLPTLKTLELPNPLLLFLGAEPVNRPTRALEQWSQLVKAAPDDHQTIIKQVSREKGENQWEAFLKALYAEKPNIVHVVAHGNESDGFVLEGTTGHSEVVIAYDGLVNAISEVKSIRLLILVICNSGHRFVYHFKPLFSNNGLASAVAMSTQFSPQAAIAFTGHFYDRLWEKRSVTEAVGSARNAMRAQSSERHSLEWSTPMLYENQTVNPFAAWLSDLQRKSHNNAPIQDEHYREALFAAERIQDKLVSLIRHKNQTRRSALRETLLLQEMEDSVQQLNDVLTLFNQGYEPESQRWLNSLRETTSRSIPVIRRFAYHVRSNQTHSSEVVQSGQAALDACTNILRLFKSQ